MADDELTLDDLSGRTPDELRGIVARLDADLADLHIDGDGDLRDLSGAEQRRWDRLWNLRSRAEARLRAHGELERAYSRQGPEGLQRAYGNLGPPGEPVERGGWVTAPGSDPSLTRFRGDAMRTLDRYRASDVLSAAAADRV